MLSVVRDARRVIAMSPRRDLWSSSSDPRVSGGCGGSLGQHAIGARGVACVLLRAQWSSASGRPPAWRWAGWAASVELGCRSLVPHVRRSPVGRDGKRLTVR